MQQHPRHGELRPGRCGEQRDERDRQADIVGQALLEAEGAGLVAADHLERPGAEDRGEPDDEDDRRGLHLVAAGWGHGWGAPKQTSAEGLECHDESGESKPCRRPRAVRRSA